MQRGRSDTCRGRAAAAALGLVLWTLATLGAHAQTNDEQAWRIAQELQCPVCQGQSVAESNSQLAIQMRALIREKLAAGESRDAILQFFVERYGEPVLMAPRLGGFNAVAWIAPYAGLAAAVAFLIWAVRRRGQSERPEAATDAPLDRYLAEVDATFDRVRDEPLR